MKLVKITILSIVIIIVGIISISYVTTESNMIEEIEENPSEQINQLIEWDSDNLFKVLVDPNDIRIIRRIKRDINKRGRTFESVIEQYYNTVRPMHQQFVEPSKKYADVIIPEGSHNKVAIDIIRTKIVSILLERNQ